MEQELHSLKLRLDMKSKMESEYINEIESLRVEKENLLQQLEERRTEPLSDPSDTLVDANKSTQDIVFQIDMLQSEVGLSQKRVAELEAENRTLRERIDILEITKDNVSERALFVT